MPGNQENNEESIKENSYNNIEPKQEEVGDLSSKENPNSEKEVSNSIKIEEQSNQEIEEHQEKVLPQNVEKKDIKAHSYNNRKLLYILLPIFTIAALLLGIFIGTRGNKASISFGGNSRDFQSVRDQLADKLAPAMYTVKSEYVDDLDIDSLINMALKGMMNSLDPHSLYISPDELQKVNEDLIGEFSGVGVSFIVYEDSIAIVDVIKGGPAEKVGLLRGDRILTANGVKLTGKGITSDSVYKTLRGKAGSKVDMNIYRPEAKKNLNISLIRGAVPMKSVDAFYMMDDGKTGYVKISSFSSSTYSETFNALKKLASKGASEFVLDLRGNPGGYMDQAILIANEFLPAGRKIVYTEARRKENEMNVSADGTGRFQKNKIAVIIDENSASASEILAGAIQDNDRGVIVGRRSFGKGLVQNQFEDVGGGALRLTVARYFTPSGRSIQKEYSLGDHNAYTEDLISRYTHGELFNADSIKLDKSKIFKTVSGRNVYGGGGIMPDVFVPEDTSSYTPYFIKAMNGGHLMNFGFKIADSYRPLLKNVKTEEQLFRIIPNSNRLLTAFADYAEEKGLPAAWYYINSSADMIVNKIKAFIARDIISDNLFYKLYNADDTTIKRAVEALRDKSLPNEPVMRR